MKKVVALTLALVAQHLTAGQMIVESGTEIATAHTRQYAQLCIQNPAETGRRILVRTTWNVGDGGHLVALSPGTQMVYRLTLDDPKGDAKFSIAYRKSGGKSAVETKSMEVEFSDKATADCSKLPRYRFALNKDEGECVVELVPVTN